MRAYWRLNILGAVAAVLVTGCAGASGPTLSSTSANREGAAPKRLVAAIQGDPHTVYGDLNPSSNIPGIEAVEGLLNAGFTATDQRQVRHPILAEAVPSLENGLWKVFPDGRMETRWTIRPGVLWHDGVPYTSADVLFKTRIQQEKEFPIFASSVFDRIEALEAPDDRSVVIRWKEPYIKADTTGFGFPMARHLLERAYSEDKAAFIQHPYFSREFVGVGAFKLREWVASSHLVVEANGQFVLGRPKIDQIEVRFIPDQNTLIANILAGTIEIALGRGISVEQAMQMVDQWQSGRMDLEFTSFLALYPQFINPTPPVVANLQFRRALAHALDRSQLAEVLQWGLVPPAHSLASPREADYPAIERFIVKYDYDPRRAAELIQTLGYTRGGDGFFRDAGGEKLSVQLRSGATRDVGQKAILSAGDYWQQIGVASEIWITPPQLQRDREYRSTYPAFEIAQQPNDLDSLDRYHSSKTPLPENNYVVTGNRARYKSAELDSLLERYVVTIPRQERLQLTGQIIRHFTENLVHLSLFYGVEPTLMVKRLQNVHGRDTWDAYAWEVVS